jgi:ABC-type multidrug transport system ATPase subunit
MTDANMSDQLTANGEVSRPTLFFESITFSDGTTLSFEDDEIVVFVGPNNAGKSATLKEMESFVARNNSQTVLD